MIRGSLPEPAGERVPNLAPMVDVIMVILVFFMLGASLSVFREGVFETQLDPRTGPGDEARIEIIPSVKIALAAVPPDGVGVFVMGRPLPGGAGGLQAYLRDKRTQGVDPTSPVVITAQESVAWRHVVDAMDAAVGAGFENVQFAVSLK